MRRTTRAGTCPRSTRSSSRRGAAVSASTARSTPDLFAVTRAATPCARPRTHDDARHAGAEPQPAAVALEHRDQRVGDRLRAARGHGVAAGGRGQPEHVAEPGTEPVVRARRRRAARGSGSTRRAASLSNSRVAERRARAREHRGDLAAGSRRRARARGRNAGNGSSSASSRLRSMLGVQARELAPGLAVPRAPKWRLAIVEVARDAGVAAVERRVAALELGVRPAQAVPTRARARETRGSSVRTGRNRRPRRARSPAACTPRSRGRPRATRIRLQHQHAKAAQRQHAGGDQSVRTGPDHDHVRILRRHVPPTLTEDDR